MADEPLSDLEVMMAQAALDNAHAQTARIKARTAVWTAIGLLTLGTLPAVLIFVYAALWGWLQR